MTLDTQVSLSEYIATELSLKGFHNLQVYEVSCSESTSPLSEKTLVWVSQNKILVVSLMVTLFHNDTDAKPLLYVDKIDSSGYLDKESCSNGTVSLAQSVVLALLSCFGGVRLHVFARAQPQFLFPLSAQNPKKTILEERKLVKWWAKTLSKLLITEKGWYYIPGETQATTRDISGPLDGTLWKFGWPWAGTDKAKKVIPRFPDDAKVKALDLLDMESSIKDFEEILSLTGECGSGRFSGFFIVDLLRTSTEKASLVSHERTFVSSKEFDSIHDLMLTGEYDIKSKAIDSSQALITKLTKVTRGVEVMNDSQTDVENKTSKKREATTYLSTGEDKIPKVLDVSCLVKKKKKKMDG